MFTLIKYEFRKTWKMKALVGCFTIFFQMVYFFGLLRESEDVLTAGILGLTFTAICGLFLIGVYSIHVLSKDVNTKQSYMLFMTPNNSYKILGAKVIENCCSVIFSGLCFIALATLDLFLLTLRYDDLKGALDLMGFVMTDSFEGFDYASFAMTDFAIVMSWVYLICLGYLAVVICATLLKGNRWNGFLSFIAFVVIAIIVSNIHGSLFGALVVVSIARMASNICFYLLLTAFFYCITAWLMENKLSV